MLTDIGAGRTVDKNTLDPLNKEDMTVFNYPARILCRLLFC
jgi:hypothetical protein